MPDGVRPPGEAKTQAADRVVARPASVPDGHTAPRPNGPAAAAHLAAGIGCLTMGLLTWLGAWQAPIDRALALFEPVGPLSGKSSGAMLAWLLAWAGLHALWRRRSLNFGLVFVLTLVLIVLGFAGTFPPFIALTTAWLGP
jgi:hypothetical protein